MCGTEEVYFATSHLQADGGIVVTASHNPQDYNGMKLVREHSKPISGDTGLNEIRALAEAGEFPAVIRQGTLSFQDTRGAYVKHLLSYIDVAALKPLKLVINAGNGGAGIVADALAQHLPFEFVRVHHEPDGHFPHGVPNPLLEENRAPTIQAILAHKADLGIAWDGDFDRCFFFDEAGNFIEGYYIVGLLAQSFLSRHAGAAIIHDPRLTWNTKAICEEMGGRAVQCKTGHAFIKERMRKEDAVYGGEMSAHHYFRDFAYCDSGMIPWLLVSELMCKTGESNCPSWLPSVWRHSLPVVRSIAPCRTPRRCWPKWKRIMGRRHCPLTTLMASAWSLRTGASMCACPTPSRLCV